ncbi:hypothetical protein [Haloferax sp. Atlit-48N]|uniref:Uncharacterized protein n=1 Tax=Haloferax sp. Atlit-48N TaxID=2077198 RepID=A0ACD5HVP8_9EURY|nr:hypothetical protein [Haloferax sp. Atlit-48N]
MQQSNIARHQFIASRLLGIVACISVVVAAIFAHTTPAVAYEVNIYSSTPIGFWVGLVGSILTALILCLYYRSRLAVPIVVLDLVLLTSLPLMRGYAFFGLYDALVHLGWTRDLLQGTRLYDVSLYPAMHMWSAVVIRLTGLEPNHVLMLSIPIIVVSFGLFSILLTRSLSASELSPQVALFVPLMLLPLMPVKLPKLQAVPTVFGLFYSITPVYFLIQYFTSERWENLLLFLLTGIALIYIHPQQSLVVAAILCASVVVHFWRVKEIHKSTAIVTVIYLCISVSWMVSRPGFRGAVQKLIIRYLSYSPTNTAVSTATPSGLTAVGGSFVEITAKLLSVPVFFIALSVVAAFIHGQRVFRRESNRNDVLITIVFIGLVPIAVLSMVFLAGGAISQTLRYVGAGLVFAGVLGAVQITSISSLVVRAGGTVAQGRKVIMVILAICLIVSMPTAYKSPYLYQPTGHVTESQLVGYKHTFDTQDSRELISTYTSIYRYYTAEYGTLRVRRGEDIERGRKLLGRPDNPRNAPSDIPAAFASYHYKNVTSLSGYSLIVTDYSVSRNVDLYDGRRYRSEDFDKINSSPHLNKVYSNGGYKLYTVGREPDQSNDI